MGKILFEQFDVLTGSSKMVVEEPFKLDPNMPLELPGLLPKLPPLVVPEIPDPYDEEDPDNITDPDGDHDGDGIPNRYDPQWPYYEPPIGPDFPSGPVIIPSPEDDDGSPIKVEPNRRVYPYEPGYELPPGQFQSPFIVPFPIEF
tara:strand:- start:27 stop:461 length:435 start_codon:yes stop_codon:yes gene_type:complete